MAFWLCQWNFYFYRIWDTFVWMWRKCLELPYFHGLREKYFLLTSCKFYVWSQTLGEGERCWRDCGFLLASPVRWLLITCWGSNWTSESQVPFPCLLSPSKHCTAIQYNGDGKRSRMIPMATEFCFCYQDNSSRCPRCTYFTVFAWV